MRADYNPAKPGLRFACPGRVSVDPLGRNRQDRWDACKVQSSLGQQGRREPI